MTAEEDRSTKHALMAGFGEGLYGSYRKGSRPLALFLPTTLTESIAQESRARELEAHERLRAEAIERNLHGDQVQQTLGASERPNTVTSEQAEDFIANFETLPEHGGETRRHRVLRGQEVLDAIVRSRAMKDDDHRRSDQEHFERIAARGAYREVVNPGWAASRWASSLAFLRDAHPHMKSVIDYVESRVALSLASRQPLMIPPLHLSGPPGVGKTQFAIDLAEALGAPIRIQSMENAQAPALWLGTERHWATASHGIVLDQIVFGAVANPLFLIDEIDKAPKGMRYDPLMALHSLLEPVTACTVRDAGLDITFDASLAIYIATSNDRSAVPESLLTRFREFVILPPRGDDALRSAYAVAVSAANKLGVAGFSPPDRRFAHMLAHLSAREIYQAVQDAAARAVQNGRTHLTISDLPAASVGDDQYGGPVLH